MSTFEDVGILDSHRDAKLLLIHEYSSVTAAAAHEIECSSESEVKEHPHWVSFPRGDLSSPPSSVPCPSGWLFCGNWSVGPWEYGTSFSSMSLGATRDGKEVRKVRTKRKYNDKARRRLWSRWATFSGAKPEPSAMRTWAAEIVKEIEDYEEEVKNNKSNNDNDNSNNSNSSNNNNEDLISIKARASYYVSVLVRDASALMGGSSASPGTTRRLPTTPDVHSRRWISLFKGE